MRVGEFRRDSIEERRRIDRRSPEQQLVMAMRSGRESGIADERYLFTLAHRVAGVHEYARVVRVPSLITVAVIDDDFVAIAAVVPTGLFHDAARGRVDGRTIIVHDVETGMEFDIRIGAVAEA